MGQTSTTLSVVGAAFFVAALVAIAAAVYLRPKEPRSSRWTRAYDPVVESGVDAFDVLARMGRAYATISTYDDIGVVLERSVTDGPSGSERMLGQFATSREKSEATHFYFEPYIDNAFAGHQQLSITKDGFEYSASGDVPNPRSRSDALLHMTKTSFGASRFVVPLLLDAPDLPRVDRLQSPKYLNTRVADERACYRIQGYLDSESIVLWIDRQSYLLRAVEYEDGKRRIEITIDPNGNMASEAAGAP